MNIFNKTVLILLFAAASCKNDKYSDFEVDKTGLHYKIISETESKVQLQTGDIVELNLKYSTISDSVIFNSQEFRAPFRMQIKNKSHQGGCFEDAVLMLKPGNKAQFIISADSFYTKTMHQNMPKNLKKGTDLKFEISIIKKMDQSEIELERKELSEKMKTQEKELLNQYISDNKIEAKPTESGLYYIETKKGNGRKAKAGDIIEVNYKGMLIDQRVFDSSYDRNETLKFKLGNGEVIAGWDEGFTHMQKGGKAKFIIPSELAYGKDGYRPVIPPYATLIFEVELVNIN